MSVNLMKWYGKEHLNPEHTKKLTIAWQAPPGNCYDYYYDKFPNLYPHWLPADHHIVAYKEALYPKDRDYRTFKSQPPEIKSKHQVEWENGYGPCNICSVCITAKQKNDEMTADYFERLHSWRVAGTPM